MLQTKNFKGFATIFYTVKYRVHYKSNHHRKFMSWKGDLQEEKHTCVVERGKSKISTRFDD